VTGPLSPSGSALPSGWDPSGSSSSSSVCSDDLHSQLAQMAGGLSRAAQLAAASAAAVGEVTPAVAQQDTTAAGVTGARCWAGVEALLDLLACQTVSADLLFASQVGAAVCALLQPPSGAGACTPQTMPNRIAQAEPVVPSPPPSIRGQAQVAGECGTARRALEAASRASAAQWPLAHAGFLA
jgi:hypothetical protein